MEKALTLMADSLSKGLSPPDQTLSVIPESFYLGPFSFLRSFFIWVNNRRWANLARKKNHRQA
jgi:hypothetical protein